MATSHKARGRESAAAQPLGSAIHLQSTGDFGFVVQRAGGITELVSEMDFDRWATDNRISPLERAALGVLASQHGAFGGAPQATGPLAVELHAVDGKPRYAVSVQNGQGEQVVVVDDKRASDRPSEIRSLTELRRRTQELGLVRGDFRGIEELGLVTGAFAPDRPFDHRRSEADGWESIGSLPGASMRSLGALRNGQQLGADIEAGRLRPGMQLQIRYGHDRGEATVMPTISTNKADEATFVSKDSSSVEQERLSSLDPASARAPASISINHRESPTMNEQQSPASQQPQAQRVGNNMPKPEWQEVIDLLKAKAPAERGRVYLPKAGAEYGGQLLMATETHIVQRVGRGSAIAHDLSKLDNGQQLAADLDAGKLRPGAQLKIQYGQDRGEATVIPFNQQRAAEIQRDLSAWAEKNITNGKGRETFLKHLTAATHDLAQPRQEQRPAPAPQRAPAMQRDR